MRSRARDYYDLWRILGAYGAQLDLAEFPAFLHQKCAIRDVTFSDPDSFFPERHARGGPDNVAAMARTARPGPSDIRDSNECRSLLCR